MKITERGAAAAVWAWMPAIVALAAMLAGCSRESSNIERLGVADRHYQAGQYEAAEIEYLNVIKADPGNALAIARMGILCQRQGQWSKALAFLQAARTNDANNLDVRRSLALTYVTLNQHERAREESEFVLQQVPADQEALFVLVDASREPEQSEAARQRIEGLIRTGPAQSHLYVALAELALRRRDLKSADEAVAKALSMDAQSSAALSALASLQFARTNVAEGERTLMRAAQVAPPRSFVRLKWADLKTEMGDVRQAKEFLEATLKAAPGFVPALSRLARISFEQNDYEACATYVRRLLTADPLAFEGRLLSARLNKAQGQGARAVEELERMAAAYPRAPVVHYELALAQLDGSSAEKSLASLNKAVALDPGYTEAVLFLADLNARRGDFGAAVASVTELIKRRPQSVPAQYTLAELYRNRGTSEDAIPIYRRLMQLNPRDTRAPHLLGVVQRQTKRDAEARQTFQKVLEMDPNHLRSIVQLVEMDLEARNFPAAQQRIEQQISKAPAQGDLFYLLAQVHLAAGNAPLAEQALRKSIELSPDLSQSYVRLAQLMIASGRQQEAVQGLEALLSRNARDTGALFLLGMIQEQLGNLPRAREAYDRAIEANPKFSPALNNAANLYAYKLKQPDKGLELARRAREQSPNDAYVADTLGWILFQKGDFSAALRLLQESAARLAEEPEVLFHVGMAHYMLMDEARARTMLERSVKTPKDFADKPEAVRCLGILNLDPARLTERDVATLDQRLAERPDDPIALARRASAHAKSGEFDKAIALCEKALKNRPNAVPLVLQLAELHSEGKNREKALEYSRQGRQLAPDDPQAAYRVGRVAFQNRDHKWAASVLRDAARNRPDQPDVLILAGLAAYAVGQETEAGALMQRAVPLAVTAWQSNTVRHFLAATALLRDPSRLSASQGQIQQALKNNPDDVPSLMATGLIHEQNRNPAEAEKVYQRVLAVYPEFAPAMKHLARIYVEQGGDHQRAFDLASKARETLVNDPELAGILGTALYRKGDHPQAARLLREATRSRTNDAALFFYLGMAHYHAKEKDESKRALNRALELNATAPFAAEAKKTLAELN